MADDARGLPVPGGHLDAVVMRMALHQVRRCDQPIVRAQVLREPGGARPGAGS